MNPHDPPKTATAGHGPTTLLHRSRRHGPAIPIASCTLIGGLCGLPFLVQENPWGFLAVVPGAIAGGLYYRIRSSRWPIDRTARHRRYAYAGVSTLTLPILAALVTGMRGQGFTMTVIALLIGASIAIGILLSGDRRAETVA